MEKNGHNFIFAKVKTLLQQGDFVFCNLEGVISDSGLDAQSFKSLAFRGHPKMAENLREAGFNLINIANNHMMQHGPPAFHDTLAILKKQGLDLLGIKGTDGYSSLPLIKEHHNMKVGYLGYSLVPEAYEPSDISYARSSGEEIKNDIRRLRPLVDFVVVSCHYGIELIDQPSPSSIEFARGLIDEGVDVFLGHHPHFFQPVERYRNGLIVYSLGDFVCDYFWDRRYLLSGIVEIRLNRSTPPTAVVHPIRINKSCQPEFTTSKKVLSYLWSHPKFLGSTSSADNELINYDYYCEVYRTTIYLNLKKLLYFAIHLPFGHSKIKLVFLFDKIISLMRKTRSRSKPSNQN
jgi:poly-gamma-glutamate synthesis protein (capsule biosynthesis protein)